MSPYLDEHNCTFEQEKAEHQQGEDHGVLEYLKRVAQILLVAGQQITGLFQPR